MSWSRQDLNLRTPTCRVGALPLSYVTVRRWSWDSNPADVDVPAGHRSGAFTSHTSSLALHQRESPQLLCSTYVDLPRFELGASAMPKRRSTK